MVLRTALCCVSMLCILDGVFAQQRGTSEQRVALSEVATALGARGVSALEASLKTRLLNGTVDTPVVNTNIVVKNVSRWFYAYVSGVVSFYDSGGVRCGDGQFKADVLAPAESVEVDTPGIRVRCSPNSWRVIATNLVPRDATSIDLGTPTAVSQNLLISIDGEEHPIQLEKPMVLHVGNTRRTVILKYRKDSN